MAPCNASFTPSSEELAWARAVIAAFEQPANAGRDVVTVNGRTVEKLHARIARRMLATARAAHDAEPGRREAAASES